MYSTLYPFSKNVIDASNQRVFAPVIGTMQIHTIKLSVNGVSYVRGFHIDGPWILFNKTELGFAITSDKGIWIEANYFYKSHSTNLWDSVVDSTYPAATACKTKKILSQHYIDGHFSLDNGLYKEAVINFGVVVEALVNRKMSSVPFSELINTDLRAKLNESIQLKMCNIKNLRNRVHPNKISTYGEIGREDAENARLELQEIMFHYFKATNS